MDDHSAVAPATAKHLHRSVDVDEVRPVTALFADVVGSTALGERLEPSEVKAIIGECVTRMCETVEAFGGVVTGQMGDGIAAFFGLSKAREDDAVRAARAALEIRSNVASFAEEVRNAWGIQDLNVRIGLNSGRVAAGPVGGRDTTVIALGDSVNVAARLQAIATPGGIVVGRAVADALAGRFAFDDAGLHTVKGRSEPVSAFVLRGVIEQQTSTFRSDFVGRHVELGNAASAVEELDSGRGQVLLIVGEGGIGKTRLLAEIRRSAPTETLWLGATCDALDSRLPYEPIEQMLRGFLGVNRSTNGIDLRVRFRTAMQEALGDHFESCAPQLARILGFELEERLMTRLEGLPPETLTRELHAAVGRWIAMIANENRVVISVDSLHDASEPTCDLVSSLIERLESLPVLIVLTMRRDPTSAGWRTRIDALANHAARCRDVSLGPLDPIACRQLVELLDPQRSLDDRLRELVVNRAEGNPLYIEQLLSAVRTESPSPVELIPKALEPFLLSRVDSLSRGGKRTLQVAAILGRTFPSDVAASMIGEGFEEAVAELLHADLVREYRRRPREYIFKHGLLRDAALSTLTGERRRGLHEEAAAAIESWPEYEIESYGIDLALHLAESGRSIRAAQCLEELGDRLLLVYRTRDAEAAFERALKIFREQSPESFFRVALKNCELLGVMGRVDAAIALADEALALNPPTPTREALLLAKATRLGEADRVAEVDVTLAELMTSTEVSILAPALAMRAWLALGRHDIEVANEAVARLASLDGASNDIAYERASLVGGIAAASGDFVVAHSSLRQAQAIAEELGRVSTVLVARRRVGVSAYLAGFVREGFEGLSEVFESYRELGSVLGQLETAVNLVTCALASGELEKGRWVATSCLELTEERSWRAMLMANLAAIEVERGDVSSLSNLIAELGAIEKDAPPWCGVVLRGAHAHLFCANGDWTGADEFLREVIAEARSDHRAGEIAYLESLHAEVAAALDQWEDAEERCSRALALVGSSESLIAAQIERIFGAIDARRNLLRGRSRLDDAYRAARASGMRLEEGRCLIELGRIEQSNPSNYFGQAREIFEQCGSKLGLQELERAQAAISNRLSPV